MLNCFTQSLAKMAGQYFLAKNASWSQASFNIYLLFSIWQILHKENGAQITQVLRFFLKRKFNLPCNFKLLYKFLKKSSMKDFKSYHCHTLILTQTMWAYSSNWLLTCTQQTRPNQRLIQIPVEYLRWSVLGK